MDTVAYAVHACSLHRISGLAGDADRWITVWAEDGVQLPPGAPMIVGKQAIYESQSQWLRERSISDMRVLGEPEVQEFGDWAFAVANYTYKATPKDGSPPYVFEGKVVTILRRQPNGEWKFYRDCFNSNSR